MDFSGKVVLITGAGRGIGEALAQRLAQEDAQVVIADIDAQRAGAVAAALSESGAQALAVTCDVGDAASIEAARGRIVERFGRVDVLINNAAAQQFGPGDAHTIDLDRYRQSFEINVLGDVRMVEAFLPDMIERRSGYIVNTASSLVIRPNPVVQHLMPYVTSKGAVLAWTYALSCAMKPHGIGVSLFCPGLTATRPDGLTYPQRMGWFQRTPAELATPASVADCANRLLQGLREERFAISSEPDYEAALVDFARAGLDPNFYSI
jgi:2-hydroxycyclohexanecarboxyl-CoA dehydrogenase